MAESKDAHIVEIPVDEEHQQGKTENRIISAIQHHPLMEISQSPGHLLLLKLWQREESLFAHEIAIKETKLGTIRSQIFQLCSFFFLFHAFFLTILFTSSVNSGSEGDKRWWIPSILSGSTSMVIVCLVQVEICRYWKACGRLQRVRGESRGLTRRIQELRMKGGNFDLWKENSNGKRMKSSSVEIKWRVLTWCEQNFLTICLLCFAGLICPASKLILFSS